MKYASITRLIKSPLAASTAAGGELWPVHSKDGEKLSEPGRADGMQRSPMQNTWQGIELGHAAEGRMFDGARLRKHRWMAQALVWYSKSVLYQGCDAAFGAKWIHFPIPAPRR